MPRKKNTAAEEKMKSPAIISDQPIVDTIEKNYMPYAMSVIVSRAIPEIDGFKPSHRKLLYTKMCIRDRRRRSCQVHRFRRKGRHKRCIR